MLPFVEKNSSISVYMKTIFFFLISYFQNIYFFTYIFIFLLYIRKEGEELYFQLYNNNYIKIQNKIESVYYFSITYRRSFSTNIVMFFFFFFRYRIFWFFSMYDNYTYYNLYMFLILYISFIYISERKGIDFPYFQ